MSSPPTWYNFGIELEMIAKPHAERDFFNYTNQKREYHIDYYERLAQAIRHRRDQNATSRPFTKGLYKRPTDCVAWWILSDGSLCNGEDGIPLELPLGEISGAPVHEHDPKLF